MIKTDITVGAGFKSSDIISAAASRLGISECEIIEFKIVRSHLDFSDKSNIKYKMSVALCVSAEREAGLLKMRNKVFPYSYPVFSSPISALTERPVVVGAGPCGLFAALTLAEAGAMPIILERGLPVDQRRKKIDEFIKNGTLDEECNVQFGEGGAGAYSDGKLKVGSYDEYKNKVLSEFVAAGGGEEILYSSSAHLGTDKLEVIIKNLREKIISLGGEFRFGARLTSVIESRGRVVGLRYTKGGSTHSIEASSVIIATGHSARDVFSLLKELGVPMQSKGFGIGLRIEHPREYINELQYGKGYPSELPTASYHLVSHLDCGRSVYSFCMCPGGTVVAAASESGGIVTNGMSEYARDAQNSNSALLVSVTPDDFQSDDPFAGIELQRKIERTAFAKAGADYRAPAECLDSFMKREAPKMGDVTPSYERGVVLMPTDEYLPDYITDSIRQAIPDFDAWMPGYNYPAAALTGPETRSTSPLRVLRDGSYEAIGLSGLYPAGEGAGYAGGIVSSAVDGIKVAEALLLKNK